MVINCLLSKGLKYNQANQTFLQWRDSKVVYGLHFQSKEEADLFSQTMKVAVDTLNRLAGISSSSNSSTSSTSSSNNNNTTATNGNGNAHTNMNTNNMNADNISLGKRSISSEYNQSIYDETEIRPNYATSNGIINHHNNNNNNSSNGIYNGITAVNAANSNLNGSNTNVRLSKQNSITSPPLSTSSSSSSSSSSSTNGLSISINNQNGSNSNLNGNLIYPSNMVNHNRQSSDFNASNGSNANQFYVQQQQQQQQQNVQVPLYQSSPIPAPPPPPPPMGSLFTANGLPQQQFNHNHLQNNMNNNNNSDNYSQKIYDVIPETNTYMPGNSNGMSQNVCRDLKVLLFVFWGSCKIVA